LSSYAPPAPFFGEASEGQALLELSNFGSAGKASEGQALLELSNFGSAGKASEGQARLRKGRSSIF